MASALAQEFRVMAIAQCKNTCFAFKLSQVQSKTFLGRFRNKSYLKLESCYQPIDTTNSRYTRQETLLIYVDGPMAVS